MARTADRELNTRLTPWVMAGLALAAHGLALVALGPGAAPGGAVVPGGHAARVLQVSLARPAATLATPPAPAAVADTVATPAQPRGGLFPEPDLRPLLPLTPVPLLHYYIPSELTVRPRLLHEVTPDLSWIALPPGPPQTAVLRLLIDEEGFVDMVRIEDASLPEEVMQAVLKAYGALRFSPGMLGAQAVRSQLRIEVRLENTP